MNLEMYFKLIQSKVQHLHVDYPAVFFRIFLVIENSQRIMFNFRTIFYLKKDIKIDYRKKILIQIKN